MSHQGYVDSMAIAERRVGEKTINHVGDYTIVMERTHPTAVDFKVYEVMSRSLDGNILDWKREEGTHMGPVESLGDASVFASGSVKWDGCASLSFDAQGDGRLHLYGPRDAAALGRMIYGVLEMAALMMSEVSDFDDDIDKFRPPFMLPLPRPPAPR